MMPSQADATRYCVALMVALALFTAACRSGGTAEISPAAPELASPVPPPTAVDGSPQPVMLDPERLVGKDPMTVQAVLGPPTLVRRDGRVQVMLFERSTCVFDITFISEGVGSGFFATHVAARNPAGRQVKTLDCLVAVRQGRPLTEAEQLLLSRVQPEPG